MGGMLVQSLVQLPGMEGVPKDVSAAWTGNGATGLLITFAIIGALEATVFVQDEKKEPGNFGNPLPLVGDDYSDEMRSRSSTTAALLCSQRSARSSQASTQERLASSSS